MAINPIKNGFVFIFLEKIERGQFVQEKTKTGIIFQANFDKSAKLPRWVEVLYTGPQCKHIKPGQQALLPALRWTEGVKYNNTVFWKSDESEVVAIRQSKDSPIIPLDTWVIFKRSPSEIRLPSGLFVIHGTQVTNASGQIISTGSKCETYVKKGMKFYFNDTNFYNDFYVEEEQYSFLKEEDILALEFDNDVVE